MFISGGESKVLFIEKSFLKESPCPVFESSFSFFLLSLSLYFLKNDRKMNKVIPVFFGREFCILGVQERKRW
jgi:hypothetical protein